MRLHTLLALALSSLAGCATYDGPPRVTLDDLEDGVLSDAKVPVVVRFSEPIDTATLHVKLVKVTTDPEGNLGDEDDDPATELSPIFSHDPGEEEVGGDGTLGEDDQTFTIRPYVPLPVGPKLAVLLEPGLSDRDGHATTARRRISFAYQSKLDCNAPTKLFPSGNYFFLVDVKKPLPAQVQLFAAVAVDLETGRTRAQFTNADRITTPGRCPTECKTTEACRLVPSPACVPPSEKAATAEEFSDYVPNFSPPLGYSFSTTGCVQDQPDGTVVFANAPADVEVMSPHVTLRNARLTTSFTKEGDVLRGQGSFTVDAVLLGTTASGSGEGGLSARSIPEGAIAGIPPAPSAAP